MTDGRRLLAQEMRQGGGLLAETVAEGDFAADGLPGDLGARVAASSRADGREGDYALLVEAIAEGYLLHYGEGRVVRPGDGDLALLAGDQLYALGLARLAELGDLDAVVTLAEVISRCAQAHAEERPEAARAAWEEGVAALSAPR